MHSDPNGWDPHPGSLVENLRALLMFLFVHFKIFLFCFWGDSYSPSLTVYYTHASHREEQRSHFLAPEEFGIRHPKICGFGI